MAGVRRVVIAVLVGLVTLVLAAPTASAQEQPTTSQGTPVDQDIIPEPDQGVAPDDSGDRGGALQYAVLGLVVVALGGGVYAVVRESRRKRQEFAGTRR
jgi:uncharacterized protein HemX